MPLALGELGQRRFWRAVSVGQLFEQAPAHAFTVTGRDLRPYSPAHVRGSRDGDDLTITWIRRTRLGGDWRDGTGTVPLAETAEAYEVDVLDGGTVVRTLSATSPAVLYPAADQTADFGGPQASVSVHVVQLSEAAGRGVPAEAIL